VVEIPIGLLVVSVHDSAAVHEETIGLQRFLALEVSETFPEVVVLSDKISLEILGTDERFLLSQWGSC
jgi:hypothetical protein